MKSLICTVTDHWNRSTPNKLSTCAARECFQCYLHPNALVLHDSLAILFILSVALKECLVVELCVQMVLGTNSKNGTTHNMVGLIFLRYIQFMDIYVSLVVFFYIHRKLSLKPRAANLSLPFPKSLPPCSTLRFCGMYQRERVFIISK